jgi:hypothetical protein
MINQKTKLPLPGLHSPFLSCQRNRLPDSTCVFNPNPRRERVTTSQRVRASAGAGAGGEESLLSDGRLGASVGRVGTRNPRLAMVINVLVMSRAVMDRWVDRICTSAGQCFWMSSSLICSLPVLKFV